MVKIGIVLIVLSVIALPLALMAALFGFAMVAEVALPSPRS
jgi:hypothetical protein